MAIPLAQEEHKELRKQIKKLKKSASLGQLDEAGTQVGGCCMGCSVRTGGEIALFHSLCRMQAEVK